MPNITLAISAELHSKMKKHSEIRWSEVVRKSILRKVTDLELLDKINSKLTRKDVALISKKIDSDVAKNLGLK